MPQLIGTVFSIFKVKVSLSQSLIIFATICHLHQEEIASGRNRRAVSATFFLNLLNAKKNAMPNILVVIKDHQVCGCRGYLAISSRSFENAEVST